MSKSISGKLILPYKEYFDLPVIFDCGQAFRFYPIERNGIMGFEGVAGNIFMRAEKSEDSIEIFYTAQDISQAESFINKYFDTDLDYGAARKNILEHAKVNDSVFNVTRLAMERGSGIRILRQEPWETLITFITSQNNNIPRIRGLIERLCTELGDKIDTEYGSFYSFPSPEKIVTAGENALKEMKFGFRAGYISACAEKISSKEVSLEAIEEMNDEDAFNTLTSLRGVGPKVADCVLLFGYGRKSRFPVDVWMKRAVNELFGGILPDFGEYAGLAQQYFFYSERYGSKEK